MYLDCINSAVKKLKKFLEEYMVWII